MSSLVGSFLVPAWWPLTSYVLPLVLAMNVLSIGRLLILDTVIAVSLAVSTDKAHLTALQFAAIGVVVLTAAIVMWHAHRRVRLGVASVRGESMLIDLRDRLTSQSQLPALPREWYAEAVMRSAGGASFAGDFVVATKTQGGQFLEVAVVDVSGKGIAAGTRALLLSGAFGGLLGSLPRSQFLPAANAYLLRQDWSEGFATAVHLAVDLSSGEYDVRTAGHPPAVQFHAGSGRWLPHWTEGPVLGLIADAEFVPYHDTLSSGDALLLYTDGLVETAKRDISYGIDKLLGEAERLVSDGFVGGAKRLVDSVDSNSDDRALLLLHRD
ncbi:MAG: serine/threonine-protein phosphatase [Propionibacteriales bacterium]|nr:serine/threonine-protein phosphatase [Propionibacteriales bacterium]